MIYFLVFLDWIIIFLMEFYEAYFILYPLWVEFFLLFVIESFGPYSV